MSAATSVHSRHEGWLTPGRRTLLLMLLVFLMPVLVGAGLYLSGWRPAATSNHGRLVTPPQPLPFASLNRSVAAEADGKWLLLIAGEGPCAEACLALATQTRAIQVSMNREMGRVRRLLFTDGGRPEVVALRQRQPDLLVTPLPANWRLTLAAGGRHRLFVVDPAGNLMMQYAPEADPAGVRADLERLLKSSWIG